MIKVLIMLFSLFLLLLRHSGRRVGSLPRVGLGRSGGMASVALFVALSLRRKKLTVN
jgi:hypothetical protein